MTAKRSVNMTMIAMIGKSAIAIGCGESNAAFVLVRVTKMIRNLRVLERWGW